MRNYVSDRIVRLLCGQSAFERGASHVRNGSVILLSENADRSSYIAAVLEHDRYEVHAEIGNGGEVDAACSCSGWDRDAVFCEHIAAVLLSVQQWQEGDSATRRDQALTNSLLGLFGGSRKRSVASIGTTGMFDRREKLAIEFICRPVPLDFRTRMFGIEIKLGPKRLYIVQRLRAFLESLDRQKPFACTKQFSYDPQLHRFHQADAAILQQLLAIYQNEQVYSHYSSSGYPAARSNKIGGERTLLIPPFAWQTLYPSLLASSSVKLEHDGQIHAGLHISDERLPLRFEFDRTSIGDDGCRLSVMGLEGITVMEGYDCVLRNGQLMRLSSEPCKQLSELQRLLDAQDEPELAISSDQIGSFVEKVVPGLMKLGDVHIAQSIGDRILQLPLKARLYLDRVRDRLLASLEFQYGDIVFNPLETENRSAAGRILLRNAEREDRILALIGESGFAQTESGFFLNDEDAEYEFLYRVVPELEKLLQVYATSAVKVRVLAKHAPPRIKVDVLERTDWLELRFDMDGIPEGEIRLLLRSLEERRRYHRLPNGSLLPLESEAFQEIIRLMNDLGVRYDDWRGTMLRLPLIKGLQLTDSDRHDAVVQLGKSFRQLLADLRHPDNLEFPVPERLEGVLRDYQRIGYGWLRTLAHYRFGGILADDMGLGKTVQAIAFLLSKLDEIRELKHPALIVCPASLTYNWLSELRKFAPEIHAVVIDGDREERADALGMSLEGNEGSEGDWLPDVLITSYPLLRRDASHYVGQAFHVLLLDEAQTIKNHYTQTAQTAKALQAAYKFALTGTPIENALEELWSIFDVVFPGLLPDRRSFAELSRDAVRRRVRPFLLRRLKSDVLKELPEKIESLHASELLPEQKKLYVAYLAQLQQETVKHLNEQDFGKNKLRILAGITRLRQICCHPGLFVEGYAGGSAKFEQLLEIIEECRSAGKRALVFSQFTSMLGLIRRELGAQGVPHFYLDGATSSTERVELCSRFNDGERDLFLISLKAGGTGLNLTGADTVILYDLWWNPAVEQQATDRAHRMGQKNVVQVIRLVAKNTVEDKMVALQQRKLHLIDDVIEPGEEPLSAITEHDVRELLMLE